MEVYYVKNDSKGGFAVIVRTMTAQTRIVESVDEDTAVEIIRGIRLIMADFQRDMEKWQDTLKVAYKGLMEKPK